MARQVRSLFNMATFDKPVETIKGMGAARMPPSKNVANENYVTSIWKYTHLHEPGAGPNQLDSRWELKDDKFAMLWYDGPQMPETVAFDIHEDAIQDEGNEDIYESSGDESSDDFI